MSNMSFLDNILTVAGQVNVNEEEINILKEKNKGNKLRAIEFEKMCGKLEKAKEKVKKMMAEMKENILLKKEVLSNILGFATSFSNDLQDNINIFSSELIHKNLQKIKEKQYKENQQRNIPQVGKNVKKAQEISVNA